MSQTTRTRCLLLSPKIPVPEVSVHGRDSQQEGREAAIGRDLPGEGLVVGLACSAP